MAKKKVLVTGGAGLLVETLFNIWLINILIMIFII